MQDTLHNVVDAQRVATTRYVIPKFYYFAHFAAMAAFIPFLALYYRQLGLTEQTIGLLTGIPPLLALFVAPLWGALADLTQRHQRLLQVALGGLWGTVLLFTFVRNPLWIVPLVFLYALFSAPIIPLVDNSVLALLGERQALYGRLRLWGALGWGVTGATVGVLIERFGLHWGFYIALLCLAGCLVASTRLQVQHVQIGQPFWQGIRFFVTSRPWLVFLITIFINGMAAGVGNNFLFLYLDELAATETLMGMTLMVATVSEIPIFFFGDRLLKRLGARGLLLLSLSASVIRMGGYALMPSAWYVLPIQLLHGFTFSAMWVAGVSYANRAAPQGMGATAQGLLSGISMGIAGATGAVVGGYLYGHVGPAATFGWAGAAVAVGLLFFAVAGQRARDIQTA
ncbi:MAG TPA: major facilitator superfamily domain-containing protein 6 [Caldilineaceae bacterium]|nr:major facilitator superfamily domain-containing protein 6 [Caldilineaceae bacterium]